MSKTLKYLTVATAALATLVLANMARTWNDDNVGTQSLKSEQSALLVTDSIAPSSITTNTIIGSDASISTYGLDSARTTDW